GIEQVGLAPADELLADLYGRLAARVRGAEAADVERRPADGPLPPVEIERGLLMGVGARIDAGGYAKRGERPVEALVAQQALGYRMAAVVGRRLRIERRVQLQEALLLERLG